MRVALPAIAAALLLLCAPAQGLEAGAAKTEITPPIGTPMNGYGARMARSSTSVHDPLWARCLYLDDGETKVLLVNTDLCMINAELRARVLELAPSSVPPHNIILTATHTHNAQGAMHRYLPLRFVAGRYMEDVLEHTATRIAESMRLAVAAKERAALGYGTAKQKVLSVNRREAGGPIDEQVGVIRVDDADGDPIAIVTNFSAHPTSVGDADRFAFSADFAGYYYDELERLAAGGCVALFMNGTEGNQTISDPEGHDGWERTASVGRLLAVRAKGIANEIECTEAVLRVGYAEPELPHSLASGFMPQKTILQTLEINDDLLLTFWPGEPVVEIGLEMRRRALAAGYRAVFNVGLANDYLMYFVPRSLYHGYNYEAAQSYYGPGIADWFYDHFAGLVSRPGVGNAVPAGGLVERRTVDAVPMLVLEGGAYARGHAQGEAFAVEIQKRYASRIEGPLHDGTGLPAGGVWRMAPGFMDMTALALPMMAIAARPLLGGVSDEMYREMEGLAAGAGIPFDALSLLQNAQRFDTLEDRSGLFATPLCTIFAVTGERAGAEEILVGRNFDWQAHDNPVITEVQPESGHRFLQVGFAWNTGVFTGMNDAGLVVAVERMENAPPEETSGAAIEMVLRDVLQTQATVADAAARLRGYTHWRGYRVLLAGAGSAGGVARLMAWGEGLREFEPNVDGLLTGAVPDVPMGVADAARYGRLQRLLDAAPALGVGEIQSILRDAEAGQTGLSQIWNTHTHHAVVFSPRTRSLYVAFAGDDGQPGRFSRLTLEGTAANE